MDADRRQALETPSADAVKTWLNGTGGSLVSYFQGFIDDLDTAGRFWDWKKYAGTSRSQSLTSLNVSGTGSASSGLPQRAARAYPRG